MTVRRCDFTWSCAPRRVGALDRGSEAVTKQVRLMLVFFLMAALVLVGAWDRDSPPLTPL